MVKRADIVAEARSWVGVKFHHMGRSRQQGVDCVGLVVVVARALDLPVADYPHNYHGRSHGFDLVRHCAANGRSVPLSQLADGDVVVFNEHVIPCHVGIFFHRDNGLAYLVQAIGRPSYRRVAETPWDGEWAGKARYVFQFPGVED